MTESIQERFERFHQANPDVYGLLVDLCRQWQRRGYKAGSIGMFWEVCRWTLLLRPDEPDGDYLLNDHYRSRYARLIMDKEADLAGFFELRKLRAE